MTKRKFLRRDAARFSKFGKRRKKLRGWKKPNGRDNKMREKRKGYMAVVSIGYSSDKDKKGKLKGKVKLEIKNSKDLTKLNKDLIGIVCNVGKKRKIEIAKKAKEMKIELFNMNPDSFLKKIEKEQKMRNKKSLPESKQNKKSDKKMEKKEVEKENNEENKK